MFRRRLPVSSLVAAGIALACGLGAVMVMRGYAARLESTRPDVGASVAVVEAVTALPRGTTLTSSMLRTASLPSRFAPPGAVPEMSDVLGRALSADIASGEVLTQARLAGASVGPVAATVPAGMRAFLVPTALPPDVVRVGDLVDIFAAFGGTQAHVETVAEGLEVAGVLSPESAGGAVTGSTATSGPTLILLVTPDVAGDLTFAVAFAKLAVAVDPAQGLAPASATPSGGPSLVPVSG